LGHPHWLVQVPRLRCPDPDTYGNTNSNSNSYGHSHSHVYTYCDGYTDLYAYCYSYCDFHSHGNSNRYRNGNGYSYSDANANGDSTDGHDNSENNPSWPHLLSRRHALQLAAAVHLGIRFESHHCHYFTSKRRTRCAVHLEEVE
jgi:hypothetical protein